MPADIGLVLVDRVELARALARYLRFHVVDGVEWYFSCYSDALALAAHIHRSARLCVLEVYRDYGPNGLRSEGIHVARKYADNGAQVLLLPETWTRSRVSGSPYVAPDLVGLAGRLGRLRRELPPSDKELEALLYEFPEHYVSGQHGVAVAR
jgi:hypothetical protein